MAADSEPTGDAERFEALLRGSHDASALGRLLASAAAPGRPHECAGLPDALVAFRAAQPAVVPISGVRRLRAVVGRNPRRAVTVVALIAGLSGVTSAAATDSLPRSVQQAAHDALPILSIPAPAPHRPVAPPSPTTTPSQGGSASPTPPGGSSARPSRSPHAEPSSSEGPDDHVPGQDPAGRPSPGSTAAPGDVHTQRPGHGGAGQDEPSASPGAQGPGAQGPGARGSGAPAPGTSGGSQGSGQTHGGHGGGAGAAAQPLTEPSASATASQAAVSVSISPSAEPGDGQATGSGSGSHGGHH